MSDITLGAGGPPAGAAPLSADEMSFLIGTAARAPSVHNTQPWRFRRRDDGVELYADRSRQLRAVDPGGRELIISCGAALFGLRLAVRHLGRLPLVELLPAPGRPDLLARVRPGREEPVSPAEWDMLTAVPHRHTHRGPFSSDPLPAGLLPALQHDAVTEGATLVLLDEAARARLHRLVAAAGRWQRRDPLVRAELRRWTRGQGSTARDGVPAHAFPATPAGDPGAPGRRLAQRDFDLGRGRGLLEPGDGLPPAAAILMTDADTPTDWLRAGQALNRILVHAASRWVFASLNSQPMESAAIRVLVRSRLGLRGAPHLLLEFGCAHTAAATARRPVSELIAPPPGAAAPPQER